MLYEGDMTAVENTDRELWREIDGDYYAPSLHVTKHGGIGINVGGYVYVKRLRDWHALAAKERPIPTLGREFEPTITVTVRRYRITERLGAAWSLLFCDWGKA